jgi:luciferase family oxidoreductase group 1
MKLSVLDQTPIRRNSNAREALSESLELIQLAEHLGYTRYWISEHHNFGSLAAAAPEVLLARLGGVTKTIRLGSGGIMLPNHSALKVSENFRLLEALFPGRVDLGIGRAPGGDRLTASLLNPSNTFDPTDYIQQIKSLKAFLTDDKTPGTVHEKVKAIPVVDTAPELWMLTSSGESAYMAAHFGMSLSYAAFINPRGGAEAIEAYTKLFKPSEALKQPRASVGIFVFCSDSEERVARMQAVMDYRLLSISRGDAEQSPDYNYVKSKQYTSDELRVIEYNRDRMIVGTPELVKEKLTHLASSHGVDEIVIATFAETREDRLRSYELVQKELLSGGHLPHPRSLSKMERDD